MTVAPIGVFDSGVGGLSILKAIRAALPHEDLCYVADSGHVPYGTKTLDYLQWRSLTLTQFLLTQNAKAVVVACNTATVAAVAQLRGQVSVPIIAVEPAVKPAVAATKTGVVGVVATAATLSSYQFLSLLERFGAGATILTQACPDWVQQVEAGDLSSPTTRSLIQDYTAPLLQAGADTLVLGCTHYPFLRPLIDEIVGPNVTVIDTGAAVTRQLLAVLQAKHLLSDRTTSGRETFWTSGEVSPIEATISRLWGESPVVYSLPPAFA